jgi:DNA modification methylase
VSLLYRSERAEVICADARDALADMPGRELVDLVVVDPPYGAEWQSKIRAERFDRLIGDGADEREAIRAILEECVRLVGQNRHLYVFGPDDVLQGLKTSAPVALAWDKGMNGAGDLTAPWGPAHESIHFLVSKYRHAGQAGGAPVPARLRKGSVVRCARATGRNVRHPTEKPIGLLAELIESSSRAGELVLDPCAGVGSTGVAAILRGRRALLIEADEDYARVAADRVRRAEEIAQAMEAA